MPTTPSLAVVCITTCSKADTASGWISHASKPELSGDAVGCLPDTPVDMPEGCVLGWATEATASVFVDLSWVDECWGVDFGLTARCSAAGKAARRASSKEAAPAIVAEHVVPPALVGSPSPWFLLLLLLLSLLSLVRPAVCFAWSACVPSNGASAAEAATPVPFCVRTDSVGSVAAASFA
jgi:hypothetical protein